MDIDIFTPVPCPEPYSLDLVSIASRFSTHGLSRPGSPSASAASRSAPTGASTSTQTSSQLKVNSVTPNKGADSRFNCTLCKKSFGTEATWTSHQKSAKHQAAVKESERKAKTGSKKAGGGGSLGAGGGHSKGGSAPSTGTSSSTTTSSPQPDSPELAEALQSLHKSKQAAKSHPALVAPVLWKTVKVLWMHKQFKDTKDGLVQLISILGDLQEKNAAGSAPQQGNLTPTQINLTLYLARLAAARLMAYETPLSACGYYVDAIQGRWQMPDSTFQTFSEKISLVSATQLLTQTHDFLDHHDKTQKLVRPLEQAPAPTTAVATPPKKQPDPNLKLLTVLTEMGCLLAQSAAASQTLSYPKASRRAGECLTPDEKSQAEFSLTALAMASAIARFDPDQGVALEPVLARRRAAIYRRLDMPHYAGQCYSESSSMPGCKAEDREWDGFQALLLALEADDPIRIKHSLDRASSLDIYLDAHVLIMIAKAVESADYDVLENDASIHVDHLRLLVQNGTTDQLLMAKHCSHADFSSIVDRIHNLVPV